jgi:hypothetical protein
MVHIIGSFLLYHVVYCSGMEPMVAPNHNATLTWKIVHTITIVAMCERLSMTAIIVHDVLEL